MVDALIRAGANVRAANAFGVQPVAIAAEKGNADGVTAAALGRGRSECRSLGGRDRPDDGRAHRDSRTDPAAARARREGRTPATRRGQTALMWAAARNNADAIRLLVKAGADIGVRTNNPPRGRAAETTIFNSPAPTGFTALLFAVRAGGLAAARALLDAGADVNDKLSDGESALVVATANAHWELASLLLDRGADPNAGGRRVERVASDRAQPPAESWLYAGAGRDRHARQHRGREEADRAWGQRQCADDEERHEGRSAQPRQPARERPRSFWPPRTPISR